MRFPKSLFKKHNIDTQKVENLIDELFDGSTSRKTELIRATFISLTCLHEAGHVMMAELHKIPIQWINLPRIDNFTSPYRPNEKKKEREPAVSIPLVPLNQAVPYLLGGLFGELNVYDDSTLNDHRSIQVFTYGCKGDFDKTKVEIRKAQNPANYGYGALEGCIDAALAASRDGAERATFLSIFPFGALPDFLQFRQHRQRHRSIAAQLCQKWKAVDFECMHEIGADFGPYIY